MKIFMDMSSILWTCLLVGKDVDGVEVQHGSRMMHVNTAGYGYENVVNSINAALAEFNCVPMDMVMVFEGRDSKKRRTMIEPNYKANREGDKDSRPPAAYVEFNLLKEIIRDTYKNLGAIAVSQPFVEGDDVLGYLADNSEEDCIVMTNDNDLIVLNRRNKFGATCKVRVNGVVGENKYGAFDFGLVTLYKGLVGDTSDNIKGCPGFGAAAWMKLNVAYDDDGCYELQQLIADGKRDEVAQIAKDNNCKLLGKIVDQWDTVRKSLRLAELHPEWVNTIKQQLEWEAGMVAKRTDDERLVQWRAAARLVTADKYDAALAFLKSKIAETRFVSFDIETSTPDESDDWLTALGDPNGVDVFGSYLVSYAITFGANSQYTLYIPVAHADTDNVSMKQAREMLQVCFDAGQEMVIQNTSFELSVLYQAEDEDGSLWRDHWKKYGAGGMVPNVRDTLFEGSYVDENTKLGLKARSKFYLGYDQASFQETMTLEGEGTLPKGGRLLKEVEGMQSRMYKMHELPATHTFNYGIDDTICTAALHNFYKLHMQIEHHYSVYLEVELDAAYLHARSFFDGVTVSIAKCKELEKEDDGTYNTAWAVLREYLMEHGWEGTIPPTYGPEITAKEIKQAYSIVMGLDGEPDDEDEEKSEPGYHESAEVVPVKDAFLSNRTRTPSKMVTILKELGHDDFAMWVSACLDGKHEDFTKYVRSHFTGEPKFKASNKQMQHLLYAVMALPIRVRGKATEKMRAAGIKEGNPRGDFLSIAYAMRDASDELRVVLEAIKLMQMVKTRRGLYYSKYPYFVHWKDGKIHSSHNQCATNTRRASSSKPNLMQLPKAAKIEGYAAKFREVIVPHKKDAVIVSMDFAAQELRVIADYSQDPNMLACFVGDHKKDMHALTAAGILAKKNPSLIASAVESLGVEFDDKFEAAYQGFKSLEASTPKVYKEYRALGKLCNFAAEYGSAAPKLAQTLLVDEGEAQIYLDAKEAAFPRSAKWKEEVIEEASKLGFVRTMLGAVRHLAPLLNSPDRFIASKADRQSVNFKVQSSSAEMTKLAEGRMFKAKILEAFDCRYYGPVHDEVVWSVATVNLQAFLEKGHACMVAPYGGMGVPIESSISFGPSFGEQFEAGDKPSAEAIAEGLAKLEQL